LEARREPVAGLAMLPLPIRKFLRYESPVETLTSCMLSLSVGVFPPEIEQGPIAWIGEDVGS